jgi:Neuraminidase (sialidase)
LTKSHRLRVLAAFGPAILTAAGVFASVSASSVGATGLVPTAAANVRVTNDATGSYMSADQLAGGTYTDPVLQRCGQDRRQQNEPTLALDPRNPSVRTSGSNDYCTIPNTTDAWAGFYRSIDSGATWTDSLLPGYRGDTSAQGTASPVHAMVAGGALAAGDPVQAWDIHGNVFFMGNNFNRGVPDGNSFRFKDNTGDVWVATYAALDPAVHSTDGQKYLRTVILATNTFGNGSFNDKTGINVDQTGGAHDGNVYAAWSDFHGGGCNEILFSRSTDHGATFSAPMKISSLCNNQGPNIAIASDGTVYVSWQANGGGTRSLGTQNANGAAFVKSTDGGATFGKASLAFTYVPFASSQFSGNGARDCGDAPYNCTSGQTFPRFDLAQPSLTVNGTDIDMAMQVRVASGQGQIEFSKSTDGGMTWSARTPIDPHATGHQFFPWIAAAGGTINAVYYDSVGDANYDPTRAPCNSVSGAGSACLNVRYAVSTDGGATWTSTQVTDMPTNPNYEQFGGRKIPFFGDYIMVSAAGSTVAAAWTDARKVVGAADPAPNGDNDGDDVAGDPETGGLCTTTMSTCFDGTGGLDQNIYTANLSQ